MFARIAGNIIGTIVRLTLWFWNANFHRVVWVLVIAVAIIAVPPVVQYWLNHVQIPEVPVSAIVALAMGSFFLLAFAAAVYASLSFLQQASARERTVHVTAPRTAGQNLRATGGDFIATSDETIRDREDMELLKRKGIIFQTDVEGLASEIGHAHLQTKFGRTE